MATKWSFLAYLVADKPPSESDKDLAPLDEVARQEIISVFRDGNRAEMDVALQVDFKNRKGRYRISTRYLPSVTEVVQFASFDGERFWSQIDEKLQELKQAKLTFTVSEEENSARPEALGEFLEWCRPLFLTQRNLLFLYGHAAGPMGLFLDTSAKKEDKIDILGLDELARVLRTEGRTDIVLFRNCFMNTLESAFELQKVSRCLVGPEFEVTRNKRWPWVNMMTTLQATGSGDPVAGGRALAAQLGTFFDDASNRAQPKPYKNFADVPMSCLDLEAVTKVKKPLKALVVELEKARTDKKRREECRQRFEESRRGDSSNPERPGDPALLDVRILCEQLCQLDSDPIGDRAQALEEAIDDLVAWSESKQLYKGVAVYYKPLSDEDKKKSEVHQVMEFRGSEGPGYYRNLRLSKETGWDRIALSPFGESR